MLSNKYYAIVSVSFKAWWNDNYCTVLYTIIIPPCLIRETKTIAYYLLLNIRNIFCALILYHHSYV